MIVRFKVEDQQHVFRPDTLLSIRMFASPINIIIFNRKLNVICFVFYPTNSNDYRSTHYEHWDCPPNTAFNPDTHKQMCVILKGKQLFWISLYGIASILSSKSLPSPMMRYISHRFFIIHPSTT